MDIIFGTEIDKNEILEKYPYTRQVIGDGGVLVLAKENCQIIGFLWAYKQDIPVMQSEKEMFINVIEVFDAQHRCKGIGSLMVEKCIEKALHDTCYQVRAYCDIRNTSSNMLWYKNKFAISPVKMENDNIPGSYVTYKL